MEYDVIIAGGGTAGCAAAYTACKLGLKALLIEKNIHLGGTITSGLVVPIMKCGDNQINTDFYDDLTAELHAIEGQITYEGNQGWFNPELTKIALDNLMAKAGVDVLFGAEVADVYIENKKIKSITLKQQILSEPIDKVYDTLLVNIDTRYVIDATGNCEIGKICNCEFLENFEQPVSLRFIMSGVDLNKFSNWLKDFDTDKSVTTIEDIDNEIHLSTACTWDNGKKWALTPLFEDAVAKGVLQDNDRNYFQIFTIAGMPDAIAFNCPRIVEKLDYTKTLQNARQSILRISNFCKMYLPGFEKAYISNIADMLGVRVSNRIKGKYIYTIDDLKSGKKFANPVVISNYPVDVHSKEPNKSTLQSVQDYELPIESLMSADIDNLFVAGRCLSADFMAQGALRVQASCFSMGEGAAKYIATHGQFAH